jgi:membrane protease YdiL (CAAX protease family)
MTRMAVGAAVIGVVAWLTLAVSLGQHFAGRGLMRKRPGFRWTGLGGLIMMSGVLVVQFATVRNWPFSIQHEIGTVMLIVAVPVLACMFTGFALDRRARGAARAAAASRSAD